MKINKRLNIFLLAGIFFVALIFRFTALDKVPPALYSDEVSQGYNAYAILRTGKDEYGTSWPVSFRSFGDWKPPLQTYLMLPTIKLFGLNAWGVRLPSAILGSLSTLVVYFLTLEILEYFSKNQTHTFFISHSTLALITAFLLAISPWHILQSRAAMLVGVTSFFYILGLLTFFKGLKKNIYWPIASVSFVLAIYGYYGMRLIVPLTLVSFSLIFKHQIKTKLTLVLVSSFVAFLLLLPLGFAYLNNHEVILGRAKTVSIFFDKGNVMKRSQLMNEDIGRVPYLVSDKFHALSFAYGIDILRRLFEHLSPNFLFMAGDTSPPFQIPNMGVLYAFEIIFIVIGCIYLIKTNIHLFIFTCILILISIAPAALTFATPASNRSFTMVLPFLFLAATGVVFVTKIFKSSRFQKIIIISICAGYSLSMLFFVKNYFVVLPKDYSQWWHFGYKELFSYLKTQEEQYDAIIISNKTSVPYIFLLFYSQIDPAKIKKNIRRNLKDDQFGFEHVDSISTYEFPRSFEGKLAAENIPNNSLFVLTTDEKIEREALEIQNILYPNGTVAFKIYKVL